MWRASSESASREGTEAKAEASGSGLCFHLDWDRRRPSRPSALRVLDRADMMLHDHGNVSISQAEEMIVPSSSQVLVEATPSSELRYVPRQTSRAQRLALTERLL